jgi:hypothetical protein
MKLTQLTAKPKLIPITIDDEDTVKEYGEPIEFWMYDKHKLETFMGMANLNTGNISEVSKLVNTIVLDEKGKPILTDDVTIPMSVMTKVIKKVVDSLGNSVSQTTEQ